MTMKGTEEKPVTDGAINAPGGDPSKAADGGDGQSKADSKTERETFLEGEARKAYADRDKAKERARDLEKIEREYKALKESTMSEADKAAARLAELEPVAAEAQETRAALEAYLAAEIAEIPEAKRLLIPELPVHKKLAWIKQAKALGAFGAPVREAPGDERNTESGGNKITLATLNSLPWGGPYERMMARIAKKEVEVVG